MISAEEARKRASTNEKIVQEHLDKIDNRISEASDAGLRSIDYKVDAALIHSIEEKLLELGFTTKYVGKTGEKITYRIIW